MKDCIFCKIVSGEIPAPKIYKNKNWFSVPDKNPWTEGHGLAISKRHFETVLDLNSTLGPELIDFIKETVMRLMKEDAFGGFNITNNNFEAAKQIIKHVHFHIVPRRKDDDLNKKLLFP